jgi:hypothetical protein
MASKASPSETLAWWARAAQARRVACMLSPRDAQLAEAYACGMRGSRSRGCRRQRPIGTFGQFTACQQASFEVRWTRLTKTSSILREPWAGGLGGEDLNKGGARTCVRQKNRGFESLVGYFATPTKVEALFSYRRAA